MIVRDAGAEDGADIARIYAPIVETTAISFEDTPPDAEEMARRIAKATARLPFIVSEGDGGLLGYAYAGAYRERAAYRHSAEVSVYVSQEAKGQGVARALYERLLSDLKSNGYRSAVAIIALPNSQSVAFHEALGFEARGVLKDIGFKFGEWHDAGFWQRML